MTSNFLDSLAERAERIARGGAPRGWGEQLLAGAARLATPAVALGVALRHRAFDSGKRPIAPAPEGTRVISVGNLTLGGSGKTPLTMALAEELQRRGRRVAIVLRGHGSNAAKKGAGPVVVATPDRPADFARRAELAADAGDEALLYSLRLRGVAVIAARRRADGVRLSVDALGCDAILLDDGFQHRAQARHADILLLDASLPAAALHTLFPRGYLREPAKYARRATAFASAAPTELEALLDASWLGADPPLHAPILLLERRLGGAWAVPVAGESAEEAIERAASPRPLDELRRERCWWVAGVAHPERFASGLRAAGLDLAGGEPMRDHDPYGDEALASIAANAKASGAARVVATEKDAVKLLGRWPADAPPLFAIRLEVALHNADAWARHCLEFEREAPEPEASIFYRPDGDPRPAGESINRAGKSDNG